MIIGNGRAKHLRVVEALVSSACLLISAFENKRRYNRSGSKK